MDLNKYDYIVVGAGFFGSVIAERLASQLNKKVAVIERRNHVGGNCYSEVHKETGIEYHKYGTHIFHTSNEKVWEYITQFTAFNVYYHQVLTEYKGKVYQMPINLETINSFYNVNLKPFEVEPFLEKEKAKESYKEPANFEEQAINFVGRPLYEAFLKGYTQKQWEKDPKDIPAHILKRLPFRTNYNESYFFDKYQGIPLDGFTAIFNKMLAHSNIDVHLNTDFFEVKDQIPSSTKIIYSGPIDRLFDYKHGDLEWRTLEFEEEVKEVNDYQGTSVMNYAETNVPFTRIHEPHHLHPERNHTINKTLIIKEFSKKDERDDPYYPIGGKMNQEIFNNYMEEVKNQGNIIVGGRLGDYKYYDMHHTIERALTIFETELAK
ncbi:UDP-galactopyranose mutase [Polaribacter sp. Hel1_85]|uniref:UDP-galactopyranose mutase n=1 Tax=Polaribacter sp. Hel1_85 TaxID=1250005 RepID=UPI00052C6D9E|nr:UDP-galactopyranose mutase [Polaribacter sp. Hel1_85]KGL63240.1 UDP-galactopyranose mutase [Polaribacter sp. Hel1_85]